MARLSGSRAVDYEAKRSALLERVRDRLAQPDMPHPSFRELAESAGVGQTTLRHYFGTLDGVIAAVFEMHGRDGAPYLEQMRMPLPDFAESVADAVAFMARGQRFEGTRAIHAIGRSEGVRRSSAGRAYRGHVLDASLMAIAVRFQRHIEAGQMRRCNPIHAAVEFAAPILFAFEHQTALDGARLAPIDLDDFLLNHVETFVRGFSREG